MLKSIVDCGAAWCGPCKMFSSIFENVSNMEEYKGIEFKKVDIDDDEGSKYVEEFGIRNIPTVLFLDENGSLLCRRSGSLDHNEFVSIIEKNKG